MKRLTQLEALHLLKVHLGESVPSSVEASLIRRGLAGRVGGIGGKLTVTSEGERAWRAWEGRSGLPPKASRDPGEARHYRIPPDQAPPNDEGPFVVMVERRGPKKYAWTVHRELGSMRRAYGSGVSLSAADAREAGTDALWWSLRRKMRRDADVSPRVSAAKRRWISEKIRILRREGRTQKQAVAIALRMAGVPPKRR